MIVNNLEKTFTTRNGRENVKHCHYQKHHHVDDNQLNMGMVGALKSVFEIVEHGAKIQIDS